MYCTKCGVALFKDVDVCPQCGQRTRLGQAKRIGILMCLFTRGIGLLLGLFLYKGEERRSYYKGYFTPLKWFLIFFVVCGVIGGLASGLGALFTGA